MPGFEDIIGQQRSLQMLASLLRKGGIPHALLFTGIEGVGKRMAAMIFSMACNCTAVKPGDGCYSTNPCGSCRSCRKISSGNHPDIIHIRPSGHVIRIDQIRSLGRTLALKPYEAKVRAVIISDAQTMNPEAGNALLKSLEEPPERTIFILTAIQTSDLLPTIVSRCQHVRFNPIHRNDLESLLIKEKRLKPEHARGIAAMAGGSYTRALSMAESYWIHRRNWLVSEIDALPDRPVHLLLAFASRLADDKQALMDNLDILTLWLRDLIVCRYRPGKIANTDIREKVLAASARFTETALLSAVKAIAAARKTVQANGNPRLALELLMMRLAGRCGEAGIGVKYIKRG